MVRFFSIEGDSSAGGLRDLSRGINHLAGPDEDVVGEAVADEDVGLVYSLDDVEAGRVSFMKLKAAALLVCLRLVWALMFVIGKLVMGVLGSVLIS